VGALKLTASPEAVFLFGPLHTIEVHEAKTGVPTGDDIRVPVGALKNHLEKVVFVFKPGNPFTEMSRGLS
jgi:hypothetical protein